MFRTSEEAFYFAHLRMYEVESFSIFSLNHFHEILTEL